MALTRSFDLQLFAQERTEPATPRKRRREREEGRVARSQDLSAAVSIMAGLVAVYFISSSLFNGLREYLSWDISYIERDLAGELWIKELVLVAAKRYLLLWLPLGLLCAVFALAVTLFQVKFVVTVKPLIPKLDRLNPVQGFKRVFSLRSLVELLKGILKASLLALVLFWTIRGELELFLSMVRFPHLAGVSLLLRTLWSASLKMALLLLALSVFDYAYQRWEFERSIRMSRQELKEEFKDIEGDPLVRRRIRQRQRELARRRMMAEVPKADVVITNPTTLAVALRYDRSIMEAPVLVAKGKGILAQRIREVAQSHDVPIVENRVLARALYEVELGSEIPEKLYKAVAEVLAFVYRTNKRRGPFLNVGGRT